MDSIPNYSEIIQTIDKLRDGYTSTNGVYNRLSKEFGALLGEYTSVMNRLTQLNDEVKTLTTTIDIAKKAIAVIANYSNELRGMFVGAIENILTQGVQYTFDERYSVNLLFDERGRDSTCDFEVCKINSKGTIHLSLDTDSVGGSIGDVLNALLIVVSQIFLRSKNRIVCLDESFKFIRAERAARLISFLKKCSEDFDIQIICITNDNNLMDYARNDFDTIYQITNIDNEVMVTNLKPI